MIRNIEVAVSEASICASLNGHVFGALCICPIITMPVFWESSIRVEIFQWVWLNCLLSRVSSIASVQLGMD